jgi:hypothetical protein
MNIIQTYLFMMFAGECHSTTNKQTNKNKSAHKSQLNRLILEHRSQPFLNLFPFCFGEVSEKVTRLSKVLKLLF